MRLIPRRILLFVFIYRNAEWVVIRLREFRGKRDNKGIDSLVINAMVHTSGERPNSGLPQQILSTFIVSTLPLNAGLASGWVSPMSLILMSQDSPVGVMSKEEISYLATLPNYVGFFLSFFFGLVSNRLGRKWALIAVGLPAMISGAVITFGTTKMSLYIGRVLAGFTIIGGLTTPHAYISETVHQSIRGMFMCSSMVQINIGILISYTLGKELDYKVYNSILIVLPILNTIALFWLPETPHFLITMSRTNDALKSLIWLRGGDNIAAKEELGTIKPDDKDVLSLAETLKMKGTRSALIISVLAFAFQTLSGHYAVLNYCSLIFKESGSIFSPGDSSILIAGLTLAASIVSLLLMDKVGRKPLLYLAFVGGIISLSVLSVFLYVLNNGSDVTNLGWIPLSSLAVSVIVYSLGLGTVPSVISNEVPPANIKPAVSAMSSATITVLIIAVVQSYPYLDQYIGLYSVFVIAVVFNILGVFFTWFMVPETKGKTLTTIIDEMNDIQDVHSTKAYGTV